MTSYPANWRTSRTSLRFSGLSSTTRIRRGVTTTPSADQGTHASQRIDQLVATNRLEEIHVRTEGQAPGPIVDDGGDDHRDSGGGGVRLELGQYLPAIKPWQLDVEHDGGRQHPADQLESLDTVPGPQHPSR